MSTPETLPTMSAEQAAREREQMIGRAMAALTERRLNFFESGNPLAQWLRERYGSGIQEMTEERQEKYKAKAARYVDTLLNGGRTPSGKPVEELSRRYQRDLELVAGVTGLPHPQEQSLGPGAQAVSEPEEKREGLEELSIEDLMARYYQARKRMLEIEFQEGTGVATKVFDEEVKPLWSELLKRVGDSEQSKVALSNYLFSFWQCLDMNNRIGAKDWLELAEEKLHETERLPLAQPDQIANLRQLIQMAQGAYSEALDVGGKPEVVPDAQDREGSPRGLKERVMRRFTARRTTLPAEPADVQREAAARKVDLGRLFDRARGIDVAPTLSAARQLGTSLFERWQGGLKAFGYLSSEDQIAALEAQQFRKLRLTEVKLPQALREMDPKTRRRLAVGTTILVSAGAGYVIFNYYGPEAIYQGLTTGFSGLSQVAQELLAQKASEIGGQISSVEIIQNASELRGVIDERVADLTQNLGAVTGPLRERLAQAPSQIATATREAMAQLTGTPQPPPTATPTPVELAEAVKETAQAVAEAAQAGTAQTAQAVQEAATLASDVVKPLVQIGEQTRTFWDALQIDTALLGGGNWVNPETGVTHAQIVKDMIIKFAQANGHQVGLVHLGDTFDWQNLLTPEQIKIVERTINAGSLREYLSSVRPSFLDALSMVGK